MDEVVYDLFETLYDNSNNKYASLIEPFENINEKIEDNKYKVYTDSKLVHESDIVILGHILFKDNEYIWRREATFSHENNKLLTAEALSNTEANFLGVLFGMILYYEKYEYILTKKINDVVNVFGLKNLTQKYEKDEVDIVD